MDLDERQQKIRDMLTGDGIVTPSILGDALRLSAFEALKYLPPDMVSFAPGSEFESIWNEASSWERVTFLMEHCGNVIEIEGKLPLGKTAMGYYNLRQAGSPLSGHLKPGDVKNIAMASLPFMGRESHAIHFFDAEGKVLYSVYVGRRGHELINEVRSSFLNLQSCWRKTGKCAEVAK